MDEGAGGALACLEAIRRRTTRRSRGGQGGRARARAQELRSRQRVPRGVGRRRALPRRRRAGGGAPRLDRDGPGRAHGRAAGGGRRAGHRPGAHRRDRRHHPPARLRPDHRIARHADGRRSRERACAAALADGCRPDVDYHGEHVVDWTAKLGDPAHPSPTIHAAFGYAAQMAVIDRATGAVERVVAVHDVGRAVNPQLCEGQIEGSVHMGLGYALTEDFPTDPDTGFPTFSTLRQLGILRAKDVPDDRGAPRRGAPAAVAVRHQGRRRDRPGAHRPGRRRRPPRPRRRVALLPADAPTEGHQLDRTDQLVPSGWPFSGLDIKFG